MTVGALVPWAVGALLLGGLAVAASRRRELVRRWCLWAVGLPLVLGLFWWGEPGVALLAVVVGSVAAVELGTMLQVRRADQVAVVVALTAVVLTVWVDPGSTARVVGAGLLLVAAVPLLAGDATHGLRRVSAGVLALVWLGPLAGMVVLGPTALAVFLAVSLADVVAYVAGPRLGGPRLSPLSPGKRWSGTVVGAACGVGLLALVGALTWSTALAVAVAGPAGDLLESMVKRGAGAEDSGTMMAGAGGLLDRIDSTLLALAVLLLLSS